MITRSYQITRVVHRSRISERKSIRSILRMTSDRTCLVRSFALSPGDRPANPVEPVAPASSFLTFPLRAYRPCSHMPAMQTRSNDSTARVPVMQTGRKQEGQQTTGAARQLSQRPANKPRWLIPATPRGFSTKRLFFERTPASRNHPLRVHILVCRISAPSTPRTRRFPTGFRRSTSSRAIFESGWQKFRLDVPKFYPEKELTDNRISVSIPVTT